MSTETTTDKTTTGLQESEQKPAEPLAPGGNQGGATAPQEPEQDDNKSKTGREAAGYRKRLRETEAERDTLAASVTSLQRQLLAGSMPEGTNMKADALWSTGRSPGEFFSETGELNSDALTTAVRETHTALGLHFGAEPIPDQGRRGGGGLSGPSWSDALRARR